MSLCSNLGYPPARGDLTPSENFDSSSSSSLPSQEENRFCYKVGELLVFDPDDKERKFALDLKIRGQKIDVWWDIAMQQYKGKFRFVGLTVTFKDMDSYKDFERSGGRRSFMKLYKQYCEREFKRKVIRDYLCVAEFQARGMIHFHYLLVVSYGVKLPFPDKSVFKWGMTNLMSLKHAGAAKRYLSNYVKKMKQLSFVSYMLWKSVLGRSFRLYEFARTLGHGVLSLMNKGWGRFLYWRVLRFMGSKWKFKVSQNSLLVVGWEGWYSIKPSWFSIFESGRIYLLFGGFAISGPNKFSKSQMSLEEIRSWICSCLSVWNNQIAEDVPF